MTEVTLVDSVQGHQTKRVRDFAERLRKRGGVDVRIVEGDAAREVLTSHKLNFGPAILIDGRLEYVGIPRWRHLQERLAQVAKGLPNPRTAAPPPKPAPAKAAPPAAPPKTADNAKPS